MIKIIQMIYQRIKITIILQIKIIRNKLFVQNSSLSTRINLCYFSFTMHDIVIRNIRIVSFLALLSLSSIIVFGCNKPLFILSPLHLLTIQSIFNFTYFRFFVLASLQICPEHQIYFFTINYCNFQWSGQSCTHCHKINTYYLKMIFKNICLYPLFLKYLQQN